MDPGLDKADALTPGRGWVAAEIKGSSEEPLSVVVESGVKVRPDLSLYGDVWLKPTLGQFGADAGARIRENIDIYASGWGNTRGGWGASAGVQWRF